ncbi:DUF1566 domain-containing protein [Desulfurivibrio dismutans]|uniref:Lcl C-terminal domain-containing protein n=1 Tax=Desulfurivibrio dismutans TaxID=1398908 RepID=UPI0023DC29EB|nr:DUF1566 domain-containing protein [Desulfurivibrio alkaliphilus]MDF1614645.1 DUF1566 domain-containing protein [Desulfurivibrio alkaliphilus]
MKQGIYLLSLTMVLVVLTAPAALAEVTCGNENSAVTATTPTTDFSVNGDGTVTHNPTGLIWMRCSLGQSWDVSTSTCTGADSTYTWQQALAAAQTINGNGGYAGHNDWRLPNKNELESIVERRCWSPAINAAIFPGTPSDRFWSSSPFAYNAEYAWRVLFDYGYVNGSYKQNGSRVRLVRAGQ